MARDSGSKPGRMPWSAFFWQDWLGEPCLRAVGPDGRGCWMDLLASIYLRGEAGTLEVDEQQLAGLWGLPLDAVGPMVRRLAEVGVGDFYSLGDGRWSITSRRMARDLSRRASERDKKRRQRGSVSRPCPADVPPPVPPTVPPVSPPTRARDQRPETRDQRDSGLLDSVGGCGGADTAPRLQKGQAPAAPIDGARLPWGDPDERAYPPDATPQPPRKTVSLNTNDGPVSVTVGTHGGCTVPPGRPDSGAWSWVGWDGAAVLVQEWGPGWTREDGEANRWNPPKSDGNATRVASGSKVQ